MEIINLGKNGNNIQINAKIDARQDGKPVVVFLTEDGYYMSSYYVTTMMDFLGGPEGQDLMLEGSRPDWTATKQQIRKAIAPAIDLVLANVE